MMKVLLMSYCVGILFLVASALSLTTPSTLQEKQITAEEDPLRVNISTGLFQGRWQNSRSGKRFRSFEGIPYAKKPIRFQAPQELNESDWKEYDATRPGAICAQFGLTGGISLEEDCLFLNIFLPEQLPETPVTMFWIHGGGYIFGSGSEMGPKYILDEDVILVTINYRLSAFGFLSTGDKIVSGNMGFKDMILALRWVQKNLPAFGGDPQNVTIFGESAGAAAVQSLMISSAIQGEGLFTKVIAQSGSVFAPWATSLDPETQFRRIANETACSGTTNAEILVCLRQKTSLEILMAGTKLYIGQAVIDTDPAIGDYSVFPEPMEALVAKADTLPLVIGRNELELYGTAAGTVNENWIKDFNKNWTTMLPALIPFAPLVWKNDTVGRISAAIRTYYFKDADIANVRDGIAAVERVASDFMFSSGVKKSAVLAARAGSDVFPYLFYFNGSFSLMHQQNISTDGPTHADDLQYLFQSLLQPEPNWPDLKNGSRDEKFSQNFIKMWCAFAKTGTPKLEGYGPEWKPTVKADVSTSDNVKLNWFVLNENGSLIEEDDDLVGRARFWNNVFDPSKEWADTDGGALSQSLHVFCVAAMASLVLIQI